MVLLVPMAWTVLLAPMVLLVLPAPMAWTVLPAWCWETPQLSRRV